MNAYEKMDTFFKSCTSLLSRGAEPTTYLSGGSKIGRTPYSDSQLYNFGPIISKHVLPTDVIFMILEVKLKRRWNDE